MLWWQMQDAVDVYAGFDAAGRRGYICNGGVTKDARRCD
jgi:hypothetical protein